MLSPAIFLVTILSVFSAPTPGDGIALHVADGWHVDVGPGVVAIDGENIALADPVRLEVPQPNLVVVGNEKHVLPVFDEKAGGWRKGAQLKALVAQECTATGLLRPETVVVRPASGGAAFVLGTDYGMDGLWATVGRLEGGGIGAEEAVYIDYVYSPARLDAILMNSAGQVRLLLGREGLGFDLPPDGRADEFRIGTVWNPGNLEVLTEENLFSVEPDHTMPPLYSDVAAHLLPKTLAKLQAGEGVTIVAWGDSVSAGGGVGGATALWYQNVFREKLQARFPASEVTLHTAAWPGRGSRNYLEAPAGGDYDFERDVIARTPDLVTLEWVNDAYLKGDALMAHYTMILERLQASGAEVLILTPHLVRPDWMGVDTLKFDEDPRPYTQGLYRFCAEKNVALADGARRWCAMWRQGIPYTTMLSNAINHPDARGHALLADALLSVFPAP